MQDVDRVSECRTDSNIRYHAYTHTPYIPGATMQDVGRVSECPTHSNIRYNKYTHTPYIPEATVRDVDRVSECHTDSNIRYHTYTHTPYIPGETVREVLVSMIGRVCALVFHLLCQYNTFWLRGWPNNKGAICTGTAPLFWNFISWFKRPRTRIVRKIGRQNQSIGDSFICVTWLLCLCDDMCACMIWRGVCAGIMPPVPIL